MKTRYIAALAVAAVVAGSGAILAQGMGQGQRAGQHGQGQGQHGMMQKHQQMMGMQKGMMQGGMMQGGMMGPQFHALLDSNEDGQVEPDEARAALEKLLAENDTNGDGTLDIAEFEVLHSRLIRETMVDRFQHLDNDGDGAITAEEITAPAKHMERMRMRMQRMQNAGGMKQGGMQGGMIQGGAQQQSD